jgi:hypothetical protein
VYKAKQELCMQQQGCQHFAYPLCTKTLVCLQEVATPGIETAIQYPCITGMPSFIKLGKGEVSQYFWKPGQIKKQNMRGQLYI